MINVLVAIIAAVLVYIVVDLVASEKLALIAAIVVLLLGVLSVFAPYDRRGNRLP